ncbi:MFS transporter [Gulosibacter chungangensis]|uniref:MFS transporter n=1 Tax=Gulosibacter chungangensis TaxID=979746 RepID=A0A7J5B7L6_9MICO|nr:MFS transporter [Gulosibacter chungangensis]KAB1640816.1 MFS transporter [Gulosibacter chungangensis]
MAAGKGEAPLSRVLTIAFLPTFIYSIGQGSIVPVIPAVASSLGADVAFAGFIAGSLLIGQAVGNLPAASVVRKLGEQKAMMIAALATIIGASISFFATSTWMLLAGITIQGLMTATFALARQSFLSTYVPLKYRARAMSSLGGVFRSGMFVGPFLAAWLISMTGDPQVNFLAFITCSFLIFLVLLVLPDIEKYAKPNARLSMAKEEKPGKEPMWRTFTRRRNVLLTLGVGAGSMMMVRSARQVVLPLWGYAIGMDAGLVAVVIGIGGAIDFALFFTSGWIMDKFGRGASAVPAMAGMGLGFLVLAFLFGVPHVDLWFIVITCWLALSNGIGSGIVMTLGADLADQQDPAPFLGVWRTITDSSGALVPFIVSGLAAVASLPVTAAVFGVIGFGGCFLFGRYIPKYVPKPPMTGPIELGGE